MFDVVIRQLPDMTTWAALITGYKKKIPKKYIVITFDATPKDAKKRNCRDYILISGAASRFDFYCYGNFHKFMTDIYNIT